MGNAAEKIERSLDDLTTQVGQDIRNFRRSGNITLEDLAERINRSLGWLSQVERGQTEPSIQDLRNIAAVFAIPVSFFFRNDQAPENERGLIVRAGSRADLGSADGGLREQLLSPDLSGDFEMIRSTFEPHSESEDVPARDTQEGGYLIDGQLELKIGNQWYELNQGDSFGFEKQSYKWRNVTDRPAIVIWVVSPPIY